MSTASTLFSKGAAAKGMRMSAGGPTSLSPDSPFRRQEAFNYINPGHGKGGKEFFKYGVARKEGRRLAKQGLKAIKTKIAGNGTNYVKGLDTTVNKPPIRMGPATVTDAILEKKGIYTNGRGAPRSSSPFSNTQMGPKPEIVPYNRNLPQAPRPKRNDPNWGPPNMKDANIVSISDSTPAQKLLGTGSPIKSNAPIMATPPPATSSKRYGPGFSPNKKQARRTQAEAESKARAYKTKVGNHSSKKGKMGIFDSVGKTWNGLSANQKWAVGAGAGVTGIVGANMAYNSITGSKNNPVGSAMTAGLLVGGGMAGMGYGGKALRKHGAGLISTSMDGLKKGTRKRTAKVMNTAMKNKGKNLGPKLKGRFDNYSTGRSAVSAGGTLGRMGSTNWKTIGKTAGIAAGGVGALGLGRSYAGV